MAQAPPSAPEPDACCGSGCARCVWDVFYEELATYEALCSDPSSPCFKHSVASTTPEPCVFVQFHDVEDDYDVKQLQAEDETEYLTRRKIYPVPVTAAKYLTPPSSDSQTIHCSLNLEGSYMYFKPGGTIVVHCQNPQADVEKLIRRLKLDKTPSKYTYVTVRLDPSRNGRKPSNFPHWIPERPMLLTHLFAHYLDICGPSVTRQAVLRMLSNYCSDSDDAATLASLGTAGGGNDYLRLREECLTLCEILDRFPSCQPPLGRLLEYVGRLKGRSFSVADSPRGWCDRTDIIFTVIRRKLCSGKPFNGLCTSYLERSIFPSEGTNGSLNSRIFKKDSGIRIAVAASAASTKPFLLPDDLSVPLIFIGTGTGIAPFRCFWRHRQWLNERMGPEGDPSIGEWVLFYGCRHPEVDHFFADEVKHCVATKVLADAHCAFSRVEDKSKRYVGQDLLEHGERLCSLISKGAVIYVCGSGAMSVDVDKSFLTILSKYGSSLLQGSSPETILDEWKRLGRYRVDRWAV